MSSFWSNSHMAPMFDTRFLRLQLHIYLQSLKTVPSDKAMIEIIFTRPMTIYNSAEPINGAAFFKSEALTFSSASLIEFIQLWPETLQHIERFSRPFCLLHLIGKWFLSFGFLWSCVPFFHFFSSDSQLCVVGFLIKQLFYSGLLDMNWS